MKIGEAKSTGFHLGFVYLFWCIYGMQARKPILQVLFHRTSAGNEPVREWLLSLEREGRKEIGEDIRTAQFGWPLGMPLIRKIEKDLWEVRSHIRDGVARVFFTVKEERMILLHGFVKKSQATPQRELETARERRRMHHGQ